MSSTNGQRSQTADRCLPDHEHSMVKAVYDNYEFLRRLTEKRFPDAVMADEAYSYAFEGLAQDDWRRVRAYKGTSSFRRYLGCVWCRLLEDFANKKFGRITPPQWIKNLGAVWEELFRLLCCRRLTIEESVETIRNEGGYAWERKALENVAAEILAKIPHCGRKVGPAFSVDDESAEALANPCFHDQRARPDEVAINKEKWIALQALASVLFMPSNDRPEKGLDEKALAELVHAIRERLLLNEEEQLILTAHFVDGESILAVGKRLRRNQNQIHGQFRRLKKKIKASLSGLMENYL
jgi:RNA polymerase sigma factor (sigma-70 family)